ncbi:PREDICTED: odorant receptor 67c-like [Dinoponera quadriceps]|uniref:Odorant receptor 67c-like n=1 Tax=Dinoponera quadriceps TaxID=609295 RepID=A0A6P3Y1S9_DINQU|nr:PREDICTED: odorant receptor 67c-like [Dinoponera quadriceps]
MWPYQQSKIVQLQIILVYVILISIIIFQVFQIITFGGSFEMLAVHCVFSFTILVYIFLASYYVQDILNHNDQVFATAYNIHWYTTPLHIQKMILFLLQSGTKNFSLNLGGMFLISLQSSTTLLSASMSYFTVLYSMQQ